MPQQSHSMLKSKHLEHSLGESEICHSLFLDYIN